MTEQRWLCVTCSATIDARSCPIFAERWLCTRAGRFCPKCRGKMDAAQLGASVALGGGVMLAVVSEMTTNEASRQQ